MIWPLRGEAGIPPLLFVYRGQSHHCRHDKSPPGPHTAVHAFSTSVMNRGRAKKKEDRPWLILYDRICEGNEDRRVAESVD